MQGTIRHPYLSRVCVPPTMVQLPGEEEVRYWLQQWREGAKPKEDTSIRNIVIRRNNRMEWGPKEVSGRTKTPIGFTSSNCPPLKTAESHQEVVCRGFHEELIKRYLGAKQVKRETWIVDGDPYCSHTVPKP